LLRRKEKKESQKQRLAETLLGLDSAHSHVSRLTILPARHGVELMFREELFRARPSVEIEDGQLVTETKQRRPGHSQMNLEVLGANAVPDSPPPYLICSRSTQGEGRRGAMVNDAN
jgi:hypothetical protein